jgi:competence protein ComEC
MRSTTTILKTTKEFLLKNIVNIVFFTLAIYIFSLSGQPQTSSAEIIFFDVGQGDAIFIQQDNFQVLIDGGPDDTIIYHLAKTMPPYDKTIEIMVLTHPHEDHIRGLMNVLDEFTVEKVFINKIEYQNRAYHYLLENYDHLLVEVADGDTFQYEDILATVIYPPKGQRVQARNINNESVVILVEILDHKILLMGDAEHEVERELLKTHNLENIYILKAGHHCSKTSTSDMFLETTNPQIAICSYGKGNKFGHPDYETIEKFQNLGVQYLETHKEGNIVIKFDDL